MLHELVLNGTWDLCDQILTSGLDAAAEIGERVGGWIPTPVPGDIHQGLIAAGRIRLDQQRCNNRPGLPDRYGHRLITLWIRRIPAGNVEIVVKADAFLPCAEIDR